MCILLSQENRSLNFPHLYFCKNLYEILFKFAYHLCTTLLVCYSDNAYPIWKIIFYLSSFSMEGSFPIELLMLSRWQDVNGRVVTKNVYTHLKKGVVCYHYMQLYLFVMARINLGALCFLSYWATTPTYRSQFNTFDLGTKGNCCFPSSALLVSQHFLKYYYDQSQ